jgi:hypothetical protein
MAGKITVDKQQQPDVEFMQLGQSTYEVTSYYDGELTLLELIKNALSRDAQAAVRQLDNPYI